MKIFSGSSNPLLVDKICDRLSLQRGNITLKSFASGERFCQYDQNIRGADIFLVQSTSHPANDNLMELLIMADAARRASAGRITAVIPYFGYSRQDRKEKSRVPISAKLVMDLLKASGFDRILTMDLHAPQIGGFTNLPFDHLNFMPALLTAIKDLPIDTVVCPDIGAVKRNNEYARAMKKELAILDKRRIDATHVEMNNFIGDVGGKNIIILDDLTESCRTLIEAATICRERGAKFVWTAITHGCFSDVGINNLIDAFRVRPCIDRLYYSNTVRVSSSGGKELLHGLAEAIEVDVSALFARAIRNIHQNESVSELFSV
jgi:ribose-phosphate pyrophosphokinase